jgi:hypothetical protein
MSRYADFFKGMGADRQAPAPALEGPELEMPPPREENFTLLFVDDEADLRGPTAGASLKF